MKKEELIPKLKALKIPFNTYQTSLSVRSERKLQNLEEMLQKE